jgi:hypothetical protein
MKTTDATREAIAFHQWIPFLATFTRENSGAHARLDVLGPDVSYQVPTDNRPFDGISADVKDKEHAVWISFGALAADHVTHGVHDVVAIFYRPGSGQSGAALEIEAMDGTKTILMLTRPEAYALPASE